LINYKLDRLTLQKQGLNTEDVDRIYRALYVTTNSFF